MKHLLLKTWLMLVCLLVGAGTTWAEDATMTAGTNGSTAIVNSKSAIKVGTSSKGGDMTITVPAGATSLEFYAAAWNGVTGLSLNITPAANVSPTSVSLTADTGIANNSPFTLSGTESSYKFTIALSNITAETQIKLTSSTTKRFVVWGATYSSGVDTRTAVNMTGFSATSTTLIKGGNTATSVTNDQNGWTPSYTYESSNTGVATVSNDGVITAVAKGTARITAFLNIANDDATWKKGATASKTIDITVNNPSHTAHFSVNGTIDESNNKTVEEGETITFPADLEVADVVFMGWATAAIVGTQNDAPSFVNTATETMGTNDVTYYAVFAVQEGDGESWSRITSLSQLENGKYIIINGGYYLPSTSTGGSTAPSAISAPTISDNVITGIVEDNMIWTFKAYNKSNYQYYMENSDSPTPSNLYETNNNNGLRVGSASDYWTFEEYTSGYFALKGHNNSRYCAKYKDGDDWRSYGSKDATNYANEGKVELYKLNGNTSYSDYCTTVSLDPKPTIVLTATELAEYAGNTNTSITASVSEGGYTGELTVESSAEAVATASISEGTITINALTAGSATITVTAPAVTGFRKNTATIAVTVSEKQAHGLSFSADVLNLTVGDTEFSEPTLNNPNSLPVVYSLVYAKPENEGKVATINSETGKLTLADPSLSTETQGTVTVKAHTDGDNSHAAGEVTYNLVVARKVTTTSWSNEGAAVTIDKDEIATLPTASNDGERNLFYESSNIDVATIDYNTGAVAFVAYGTTTITVKTTATAEYAATSATYELTFAPRYTVTFSINGEETERREETTGAGVTAPAVEPIEGKVFRGWAEATIDGTTDVAPTFVTTADLDGDKTLYAVFATKSDGEEGSVDFTISSISNLSTSNAQRTQTTDGITFTFSSVMDANVSGTHYVQMAKSSTLTQSDAFAGNIKSITFEGFGYSSTSNASMLVEGKKGNGDYATVQSCGSSYTGAEISFGSNEYDFFKITIGSERTVKFTKMTVEYSGVTYSDYCTTVKTTPTLSFAELTYNATVGGGFDAPELTNPQEVSVTYSSSEESVATVDSETGAITLVGAGTTTITATFAGNATYKEASASYELVVAPVFTPQTLTFKAQNDDGYYATFSSSEVTFFTGNVVVSAVGAEGNALYLFSNDEAFDEDIVEIEGTEVTGYYVPANTGVLVYSTDESATYYTVTGVTPSEDASAVNMLVACPETGTCPAVEGTNYYYKLAYGDNTNKTKLGFWWGAADGSGNFKVKAGGAVLVVPQSADVRGFSFTPDGILTGVNSVSSDNNQNIIYNLQGMRMLKVQRGVNIVNGRKVIR